VRRAGAGVQQIDLSVVRRDQENIRHGDRSLLAVAIAKPLADETAVDVGEGLALVLARLAVAGVNDGYKAEARRRQGWRQAVEKQALARSAAAALQSAVVDNLGNVRADERMQPARDREKDAAFRWDGREAVEDVGETGGS
jgi:hypothetical protein